MIITVKFTSKVNPLQSATRIQKLRLHWVGHGFVEIMLSRIDGKTLDFSLQSAQ